ncbi:MAG: DCC1-like thiol-disulfide oxidoreductase family protein [Bacteroidota bacterium]
MENNPIIFYDGLCGLCDRSVQFIIKYDQEKKFRFAALQSDFAKQILGDDANADTFILFEKGKIITRSTAALRVCKILSGKLSLLYIFILVPAFIRDAFYDLIARNRYKWFGHFDKCKIPTPEQKELFIS